jgi:hypothetical protein
VELGMKYGRMRYINHSDLQLFAPWAGLEQRGRKQVVAHQLAAWGKRHSDALQTRAMGNSYMSSNGLYHVASTYLDPNCHGK